MPLVDAVFRNGVFEPLDPVSLPENQRVRLQVDAVEGVNVLEWVDTAQLLRQAILARHGLSDDRPDAKLQPTAAATQTV